MIRRTPAIIPLLLISSLLTGITGCTKSSASLTTCTGKKKESPSASPSFSESPGSPSFSEPPSPSPAQTAMTAPDGGTLRIVESGFSYNKCAYGECSSEFVESANITTVGIVLENTSKSHIAADTTLIVKFIDAKGKIARVCSTPDDPTPDKEVIKGNPIFPEKRMGFATLFVTFKEKNISVIPARIEVEIGASSWWNPATVKKITASDIKTQERNGTFLYRSFSFVLESEYPFYIKYARATVLERDSTGTLIGGYHKTLKGYYSFLQAYKEVNADKTYPNGLAWQPGRSNQVIWMLSKNDKMPAGGDPTKSELYITPTLDIGSD